MMTSRSQKTIFSDAAKQAESWRPLKKSGALCVNLRFQNPMSEQATVSNIFRRALELRQAEPNASMKDIRQRLLDQFKGNPFPSTDKLTIPEYDNITPEEDWTAGLPVVLRGIQNENWDEIADGIIISLEQVENYPKQSLREDDPTKEWRNRTKGIAAEEEKVLNEWMPEDLMAMAKRNISK
jgi:hypothetical protein